MDRKSLTRHRHPSRRQKALLLLVPLAVVIVIAGDALVTGRNARARWLSRMPPGVLSAYTSAFSGDPVAHYVRGLREREGDSGAALRSFARAASLDPGFLPARACYAGALLDRGDGAQAYQLVQQCLAADSGCVPALVVLGRLHARREEWPKALECAETALRGGPEDADAWLLRAQVQQAMGDWPESARSAARAADLNPGGWRGWVAVSRSALALRDAARSRAAAEKAIALNPGAAAVHVCLGEARLAGRAEERAAEAAFREALRLEPENADAALGLGRALARQRRWKEAVGPLAEAVERQPLRNDGRRLLAESFAAVGDAGRATLWRQESARWAGLLMEKARIERQRAGTSYDHKLHFKLAKLYGRMGLWEQGLQEAEAGLQRISQPYAAKFARGFRRAYSLRHDPTAREAALRSLADL